MKTVTVKLSEILPTDEEFDMKGINYDKLPHSFLTVNYKRTMDGCVGLVTAIKPTPLDDGDIEFQLSLEFLSTPYAKITETLFDKGLVAFGAGGKVMERVGKKITKFQLREISIIQKRPTP